MEQALNGNSLGTGDVNYIHFDEEQSGLLLPSCPGYPFWLPQLQLTAKGRLCFGNFPAKLFSSVISNAANADTWNFAIDGKTASQQGKLSVAGQFSNGGEKIPFPNISFPADGSYFNQNCLTFSWLTQADVDLFKSTLSVPRVYTTPPDLSKIAVGRQGLQPAYSWIMINVQYYINRYLKLPYNVWDNVPYTDSWARNLNLTMQSGDLSKFLSGVNFLVQPVGGPSFWDKVISAAPLIIGGIASIMTLGAAAPALVAAAANLITSTAAKDMAKNQTTALQTAAQIDQLRQGSIDMNQIQADVAKYSGFWYNASDNQKKFIFFSAVIVLLAIIIIIKTKTK